MTGLEMVFWLRFFHTAPVGASVRHTEKDVGDPCIGKSFYRLDRLWQCSPNSVSA